MTGRGRRRRDRRTHRIPIRFTYQELTAARRRAHATGRPLARYIRDLVLRGSPRALRLQAHDDVVHAIAVALRILDDATDDHASESIARAAAALRALLTRLAA